jgi:putative exosortase-associated protein (TIGR04073 family)
LNNLSGTIMKKYAIPLFLASCLLAFSSVSSAEENQSYGSKVGNKALNGFANMATGVLEIPKSIINVSNESNVIWGIVGGSIKGVLNTVGRLATGIADLITAPLPTKPIVYPAYVWDDFDMNTTYGEVFRLDDGEPVQSTSKYK